MNDVTPCYVYVIGSWSDCERGGSPRTYTGWTHDVAARLAKHNTGQGAKATRGRVWELLYTECFQTRMAAMAREAALKKELRTKKELRHSLLAARPEQS